MTNYVCVQCGTQFGETDKPRARCPVCDDERQYVNWDGQQWTTLEQLRINHSNRIEEVGANLFGIATQPSFAIGQSALLVQSPGGNILWDCVTLLDEQTIQRVNALGGIRAFAISHPHYYSAMIEWSRAFHDAPIFFARGRSRIGHARYRTVRFEQIYGAWWQGNILSDGKATINCSAERYLQAIDRSRL
jgi:hypothetical protein